MLEERIEIEGIPAKVYDPCRSGGLLLLGHGGGHGKDAPRFVGLARHYAEQTGLAVVCIDAVDHGERSAPVAAAGIPAGWHSNTVDRMVKDWRTTTDSLSSMGPPVAYVGFSMGAIFGPSIVAAIPSIRSAVFVVGGVPAGGGIDDPALRALLLDAASKLGEHEILMLNKAHDAIFPTEGVHALFDAIPGSKKHLMFWDGEHDDWPPELIDQSVAFLVRHAH